MLAATCILRTAADPEAADPEAADPEAADPEADFTDFFFVQG